MSDGIKREEETGRFLKGQKGGPGRPKGSRNALGEAFLADLQADWKEYGTAVIATVRAERPQDYLKVVASILPKEHLVKTSPLGEMDDDELASRLEVLEQIIGFARGDDGTEGPTHKGGGTA
jgi:hypothetical protein